MWRSQSARSQSASVRLKRQTKKLQAPTFSSEHFDVKCGRRSSRLLCKLDVAKTSIYKTRAKCASRAAALLKRRDARCSSSAATAADSRVVFLSRARARLHPLSCLLPSMSLRSLARARQGRASACRRRAVAAVAAVAVATVAAAVARRPRRCRRCHESERFAI